VYFHKDIQLALFYIDQVDNQMPKFVQNNIHGLKNTDSDMRCIADNNHIKCKLIFILFFKNKFLLVIYNL